MVDQSFIRRVGDKEWTPLETKRDGTEFATQLNEFVKYVNGEESEISDGVYSREIIRTIEEAYKSC